MAIITKEKMGTVKFKIELIMKQKNISRKQMLEKTGLKNEVFNRYYYSEIKRIDIDVILKICNVLECNIGDVIEHMRK